jgi:hypothetical protein
MRVPDLVTRAYDPSGGIKVAGIIGLLSGEIRLWLRLGSAYTPGKRDSLIDCVFYLKDAVGLIAAGLTEQPLYNISG